MKKIIIILILIIISLMSANSFSQTIDTTIWEFQTSGADAVIWDNNVLNYVSTIKPF